MRTRKKRIIQPSKVILKPGKPMLTLLEKKSTTEDVNTKWGNIVTTIITNIRIACSTESKNPGNYGLAIQDHTTESRLYWILVPHDISTCDDFVLNDIGDIDNDALKEDEEALQHWYGRNEKDNDKEGWVDHVDKMAEYGVCEDMFPFVRKHMAKPILVIETSNVFSNGPGPTEGPKNMEHFSAAGSFQSFADILEHCVPHADAKKFSICSTETGLLLSGQPWKTNVSK
jgi:hypothetical protein